MHSCVKEINLLLLTLVMYFPMSVDIHFSFLCIDVLTYGCPIHVFVSLYTLSMTIRFKLYKLALLI